MVRCRARRLTRYTANPPANTRTARPATTPASKGTGTSGSESSSPEKENEKKKKKKKKEKERRKKEEKKKTKQENREQKKKHKFAARIYSRVSVGVLAETVALPRDGSKVMAPELARVWAAEASDRVA